MAAAGTPGKGRVVGFTHGSFLKPGNLLEQESVKNFVLNSIRWAGRSASPKSECIQESRTSLIFFPKRASTRLPTHPGRCETHKPTVYCLIGHENLADAEIVRLFEFANDGGGVAISTTPWAFQKEIRSVFDFPGNQIFSSAGMQFLADGYAKKEGLTIGSGSSAPPSQPTTQAGKDAHSPERQQRRRKSGRGCAKADRTAQITERVRVGGSDRGSGKRERTLGEWPRRVSRTTEIVEFGSRPHHSDQGKSGSARPEHARRRNHQPGNAFQ